MKKIILQSLISGFLLLIATTFASAQIVYVTATTGLRLRANADAKSAVLALIPFAQAIDRLGAPAPNAKKYTIEGIKGQFVEVQYGGKRGFVFDGFLAAESPVPLNVPMYVVANSGLRLREKADANSAVLATIPFADSIVTDGAALMFYDIKEKYPKRIFKVENIEGFWQKVVYKGKKGFVFSGFVSQYYKPEIVKSNYVFIEEGWGCGMIVQNTADFNWLAWYKKGDKMELKAIKQPFFGIDESGESASLITKTDRTALGDTALFIIGVRKTVKPQILPHSIKEKWYSGDYYDLDSLYTVIKQQPTYIFKQKGAKLVLSIQPKSANPDEEWDIAKASLVLETMPAQTRQTLRAYNFELPDSETNSPFWSFGVLWQGDLDGDGKLDFLLRNNDEMSASFSLYLSSAAEKGQIVKQIGTVHGCGC